MPHLNKPAVVDLIARKYPSRDGIKRLAADINIPYGTLRNAVHGTDQIGMGRIYEIARALGVDADEARALLVATGPTPDGTPDKTPEPRKVPKPEPQRKEKAGKAPKRATDRWAS